MISKISILGEVGSDENWDSIVFSTKSGRIFGCGYASCLGIDDSSGIVKDPFVELNVGINKICDYGSHSSIILEDSDGKIYMTNSSGILFRDSILEKKWVLVADNVKKFNARTYSGCLAYIDYNDDLWVIGNDSCILGTGSEVNGKVERFIRLKDILVNYDIYDEIDGNVKDYSFSYGKMYILTKDNVLYVSGHYKTDGWAKYNFLGTTQEEDCNLPTRVLDNVDSFMTFNYDTVALRTIGNSKEIWCWGVNDGNTISDWVRTPKKWDNASTYVSGANKVDLLGFKYISSYININKDNKNKLMFSGIYRSTAPNGMDENAYNCLKEVGEYGDITCMCFANNTTSCMFLTSDKKLYGFGNKNLMGIGSSSSEIESKFVPIIFDKGAGEISSITGGNGWYIVTTDSGEVFGTGSNNFGILGRWNGADGESSSSRYKTAFEWVECPELEL